MSDRTLDRILGRRPVDELAHVGDDDGIDDLGCFGWLRGVRERALMLELRKRTGHIKAFGYAWLECAEFDPSDGITLYFPGHVVRIRGTNLNGAGGGVGVREGGGAGGAASEPQTSIFRGIQSHRVPWLCELPSDLSVASPPLSSGPPAAAVRAIEW